jgi:hypothetical protein
MTDLVLHLKRVYFEEIKAGTKTEEYRKVTEHWIKRIERRTYDRVVLLLGYPARGDESKRIVRPWRGYTRKIITHEHFGPDPVEVFAIRL